jgi:hypothetical protein
MSKMPIWAAGDNGLGSSLVSMAATFVTDMNEKVDVKNFG